MKTMKKVAVLVLAMLLCLSAFGCSTSPSPSPDTSDTPESSEPSATDAVLAPGEGATKMGVILVGTRDDYGYNQGLYDCSIGAIDELGIDVLIKESVPEDSSAQAVMEQLIAEGCKIIYATSYGHREYAEEVAVNHPDVAFFVTNQTGTDMDNISCLVTDLWESAYINGVCAGSMTETNELGYIASFQIPTVIASINAFTLGVQSVNPDAVVHAVFTGSWDDVGLQTNAVNGMVSQNIDVIAQYQDYTKTIVEMCEEAGIYCVGYHVDTSALAPDSFIIGTLDTFVKQYAVMQAAIDGDFAPVIVRGGYADGMCANTECTALVPDDVKALVQEAVEKCESGDFNVFTGPIKNQDGEIAIAEGEALSQIDVDGMDYFIEGVVGLDS